MLQYSPDFSNEIYVKIKNNVFKENCEEEFKSSVNTFQKSNKNKIKSALICQMKVKMMMKMPLNGL